MAVNMDAILRIAAQVTGSEAVSKLTGSINQAGTAASGLLKSAGPLGGALGALAPAVTIAGITALSMKSLDAAQSMYTLSQRTGVSVESLSKFKKAAGMSGTDIDSVAKSIAKLSKELYSGNADKALSSMGLSAKDASGHLKSADAVMFEVANKFKAMPAGVEKTALAIQLFGRSGAEMVPMLNLGGDAIEKMGGKMTTAFAEKAHDYEVKLTMIQGKIGGMATSLMIALIPALDAVASAVLAATDAMTKLPGWLQTIIGLSVALVIALTALAPAITALGTLLGGLATLSVGATLASWVAGFASVAAGVATFVAAVVTAPVLIGAALIAAGAAIFIFRDSIGKTFQEIWATIADPKTGFIAIIGMAWNNMVDGMKAYLAGIVKPIADTWNAIVNSVRGAINGAIRLAGQGINALIEQANRLLFAYNAVANVTHLPQVGLIQYVQVPQFADGGRVDRPTLLMAGEGGQPEYIVPQSKVPQFIGAHMGDAGLGLQGGAKGGQAPVVNISTGPVMQQPDGSRWVSVEDAQGMVSDAADQIWRGLTSYDGRRALGLVR
jgi:hypothetical protein